MKEDNWERKWFWERVFIISCLVILAAGIIIPSFSSPVYTYMPYDFILDTGYSLDTGV